MGGADIIPGVSGGTMALILGIYRRLIDALSHLFSAVPSAVRLDLAAVREQLRAVEWGLLLPLGVGIVAAIAVASQFIPALLEHYPHQMRGLFFGLVAASIAVPWLRIGRLRPGLLLLALAGAAAAFFFVGLPVLGATEEPGLLRIFASAAVAICAMILPGVSGAFLLEVLGVYEPTTEAVKHADVLYVLVFGAGAALGLGLFSNVLDWLLDHHHDRTMAALVGLMAGSLRALWPWQPWDEHARTLLWPAAGDPVASVLLLGALGFAFVAALTWWGRRQLEVAERAEDHVEQPAS